MSTIRQDDLIASVADALQYISYYHPIDYIGGGTALRLADHAEQPRPRQHHLGELVHACRGGRPSHRSDQEAPVGLPLAAG